MATFSKEIKSNRLLQSKRYTRASADSQEAFTRVIDLNASEIYSQESLLPTSSLPYSGSSQNGNILTGTDNSTPIAEYYYRLRLTPDNVGNGSYFALSSPQSNIDPQTVQSNQIVDWLSNKYLDPAIAATTNAESTPVGYTVQVTNGSTAGGATAVSPNDYQFDYKSGVLQFIGTPPANNIYLSGYVYQGRTLASDATTGYSGSFSGSFQGSSTGVFTGIGSGSFSGSFEGAADLNSLTVTGDSTLTGNTDRTGTLTQNGNLTLTGSFNHTGSYNLTGSIDVVGPIISNGINVVDNAIAMAIALG